MGIVTGLVEPTAMVGEVKAGEEAKARKSLEKLILSVSSSSFDIGILAHQIKSKGLYSGFTTCQDYFKTLPIKLRKLQYLRRIAEVADALSIPREKYEPVGVAKLREITSLDLDGVWKNPENGQEIPFKDFITGFIEKGKEMPLDDIKRNVKTLKGLTGENDIIVIHFGVKQSVLDNVVRPALDLAKANLGSAGKDDEGISFDASDGRALETIGVAYLIDPANTNTGETGE